MEETAQERMKRELEKVQDFLDLLNKQELVGEKLEKIKQVLRLLEVSKVQNVKLLDKLHKINDEQLDVLHEIELEKFCPAAEDIKLKAEEIRRIRQLRRAIKDTLDLWRPLKNFANSHLVELDTVLKEIEKTTRQQTERVYHPRVKADSSIDGKHYETIKVNMESLMRA